MHESRKHSIVTRPLSSVWDLEMTLISCINGGWAKRERERERERKKKKTWLATLYRMYFGYEYKRTFITHCNNEHC